MKMKLALLSVFLALPMLLPAQTAKVYQLSDSDAKEAKALYAEKSAVEAKIEALNKKVGSQVNWVWGFEFSEDFRFVVPKQGSSLVTSGCCSTCASACLSNSWITNFCQPSYYATYATSVVGTSGTKDNLGWTVK